MYQENEELQIEKLKEMKGDNKVKRKAPKKKPEQLFDMAKKTKSNKKVKKKKY